MNAYPRSPLTRFPVIQASGTSTTRKILQTTRSSRYSSGISDSDPDKTAPRFSSVAVNVHFTATTGDDPRRNPLICHTSAVP